jgi:hypothetical protein
MSDPKRPPADHSVKIPHLVFGLLFLGAAGIWALVVAGVITENRLPILAPAVLIVAGVIGLAVSLASTRNRRQRQDHAGAPGHHEPTAYDADGAKDGEPARDGADHHLDQDLDQDLDHTQEIR